MREKPIYNIEINYSFIYLPFDTIRPDNLINFVKLLSKAKNKIQIAYSLIGNEDATYFQYFKINNENLPKLKLHKNKLLHITKENTIEGGIPDKTMKYVKIFS